MVCLRISVVWTAQLSLSLSGAYVEIIFDFTKPEAVRFGMPWPGNPQTWYRAATQPQAIIDHL